MNWTGFCAAVWRFAMSAVAPLTNRDWVAHRNSRASSRGARGGVLCVAHNIGVDGPDDGSGYKHDEPPADAAILRHNEAEAKHGPEDEALHSLVQPSKPLR
jgi:hypothetical protein